MAPKRWSRPLAFGFKCPATILRDENGAAADRSQSEPSQICLEKLLPHVEAIAPGFRSLGGCEVVPDQLQRGVGVDATRTEVIIATDRSEIVGAVSD